MGSEHNRLRRKWQSYGGKQALVAEKAFFSSFNTVFQDTEYRIRDKPIEFKNIYVDYPLPNSEMSEIFHPENPITQHGVSPDFAIDNMKSGKTIYVEVKRQDGWVEGGRRADGRGNAHERSCKFFTPGLLDTLRKESGIAAPSLPFWTVFQGNITRDPCRVREIAFWYAGFDAHFFFWRQSPSPERLLDHFESHLAPLLD